MQTCVNKFWYESLRPGTSIPTRYLCEMSATPTAKNSTKIFSERLEQRKNDAASYTISTVPC